MKTAVQQRSPAPAGLLRNLRHSQLIQVLPALLALCFTFAVFSAAVSGIFKPTPADFQKRAAAAIQTGNVKEAVILLRRQLIADPSALEPRLRLLESLIFLQQTQAASEILNQIAPADRLVYGPAHLYRASLITAGGVSDPTIRVQAIRCLELALKADPAKGQGLVDQDAAQGMLAEVLSAGGDWQGALSAVDKIIKPSPANRVLKATVLKNLRRFPEATALADQAMSEAGVANPGDTLEVRLRRASVLAQASWVKGDFDQAVKGVLAAGDEPSFKVLQATIIRQTLQALRSAGSLESSRWLENLLFGLLALPDDIGLTTELIEGVELWNSLPGFAERTTRRLRESGLGAHMQLLEGLSSLRKNLPGEAFNQFKEAWEVLPGNPVLANNYAAMLGMRGRDADRAAALVIIDDVLKDYPDAPSFQDTKGQILLSMRRPEEAVPILKLALKRAPLAATHLALAEAYSLLGRKELADHHRGQALGK